MNLTLYTFGIFKKINKNYLTIFLIYLVFVVFWTFSFHLFKPGLDIKDYRKWDGGHYKAIALQGYKEYPCKDYKTICGNVGWYPFYPLVGKATWFFFKSENCTVFVSFLFFFCSLLLLFELISKEYSISVFYWTVFALFTFPTSFYFLLGFPYSLFLFLSLMIFLLLRENKVIISSIFEGLLLITYPTGILIYLPKTCFFIENNKINSPKAFFEQIIKISNLIPFIIPIFFILIYFSFNYYNFGDFFISVHFQSKYGHHLAFPLWSLLDCLKGILKNHFTESNVLILYVLLGFGIFFTKILKPVFWLYAVALFLADPFFGTTRAIFRLFIVAFPFYLMIAVSKRHWSIKLLYFFLGILLGVFFFARIYIRS